MNIKYRSWLFPVLLWASLLMSTAQAATLTFNFSQSLAEGFLHTQVATLTVSDVAGGATKWTLNANWSRQYGSAFLHFLNYEYLGNSGLTASDYKALPGTVAVPSFDNRSATAKIVTFQAREGSGRFEIGESVSWYFANTKTEDFRIHQVWIEAINNGRGVGFAPAAVVPPRPSQPNIPEGTVSRDFTVTVAGIDNNQNGVRDDIEDFIGKTYADPKQRAAMIQYAASEQKLLHSTTKNNAFEATKQAFRALDCTREVFGKSSSKLTRDVLAMTLNTKQRALAYAEADKLSSGQVYDMFVKNPCDAQ